MSFSPPDAESRKFQKILIALLLLKILIMGWNAAKYVSVEQYDYWKSHYRLNDCGLEAAYMGADPPLYYMLGCPLIPAAYFFYTDNFVEELLIPYLTGETDIRKNWSERRGGVDFWEEVTLPAYTEFVAGGFRWINMMMVVLFYAIWLFRLFPKLLPRPPDWFTAGLLLLLLPGFQKIAVMIKPDNATILAVTIAFALWLQWRDEVGWSLRRAALFACAIGAMGLTRPLAIWPVLLLGLMAAWKIWIETPPRGWQRWGADKLRIFSVYSLLVIVLCGSWWAYRYVEIGVVVENNEIYMAKYRPKLPEQDRFEYFSQARFADLLRNPNRRMDHADKSGGKGVSFWAIFYSDLWGDHWLYFSGPKRVELKPNFKRFIFVLALPLTLFAGFSFVRVMIRRSRDWMGRFEWDAVFVSGLIGLGGVLTWLLWEQTNGLTGKHGGNKFQYYAWAVPFLIPAIMQAFPRHPLWRKIGWGYLSALFLAALPIAVYWR